MVVAGRVNKGASSQYYYGTGKRKTSMARVRITPGQTENLTINGKDFDEIFPLESWRVTILEPFKVSNTNGKFLVNARLSGGGISGWVGALRHGITMALVAYDASLKPVLRDNGLMTRDSRVKERKKYGLKGARRAPQYTKR
jgi:small subunit ribosomal protein S9